MVRGEFILKKQGSPKVNHWLESFVVWLVLTACT